MQRSHLLVLIGIVLALLAGAIATYLISVHSADEDPSDASRTLKTSETQVFTDLEGNEISFDQYEGKIRVINVWASWSPLSRQELSDMQRFASDHAGDDIAFIAINRKESSALARQYLDTFDIGGELIFAIDTNDSFYSSVGGYAMPETVIYGKDGETIAHVRGTLTYDRLAELLQQPQ